MRVAVEDELYPNYFSVSVRDIDTLTFPNDKFFEQTIFNVFSTPEIL